MLESLVTAPKEMNNYSRVFRISSFIIGAILLIWFTVAVGAQSGRHVRKPTPAAPIPTPEAEPTPTPTPERPKPTINFLVGMDRFAAFSRVSLNAYSGVLRNCADRLDDSLSVKASTTSGDLSRSDAVRKAKAEKEIHVVWLQLRENNLRSETGVNDDPYDVYIQYAVFEPVTGKQVTSGSTYPDAYRNKRIRVPTSTGDGDYYLNQAARGAAERILDHFHARVPNTRG